MRIGAMQNIEEEPGWVGGARVLFAENNDPRWVPAADLSRHILVSISGPACCASASASTSLSAWTIDIDSSRIKIMFIPEQSFSVCFLMVVVT